MFNKRNYAHSHSTERFYYHNNVYKYHLFIIWFILVFAVILICLYIMIIEHPLSECDFMSYISNSSVPISQNDFNTNDLNQYKNLNSDQLLHLTSEHIPNITDFMENG